MRPARPTTPLPLDPAEARKAAFAVGLRLLAGREMSAARMREKLQARGFGEDVVVETIERLTRVGALDDERAARAAARNLAAIKQRGRHRVVRELERLGFPPAHVEAAVAEVLGAIDESAVVARLVESRLHGTRRIPDPAAYRRLYGMLLRRGFPSSAIRTALQPYWRGRASAVETDEE